MIETYYELMRRQGISRRSFLKFCSLTAASLGLGDAGAQQIAQAMETKPRTPVDLAARPGMHLLQRVVHPLGAPAREGRRAVDDLARLRRHADGRRRPPGRGAARADDRRSTRATTSSRCEGNPPLADDGIYCIPGGKPFVEKLRRVAKDCQGHRLLGHVRVVGLRAGGQAESDARHAGAQGHHRQADHQGAGLPADRRGDDRRRHLHADLRPPARSRRAGAPEDVLQPARPRQVLSPAALRRRPVRRDTSTTKARARATACTRWAARARSPTTPARRCAGTTACRSRSSPATAASAAPRTGSGTRAASTTT